ncbi:hypothetical protein ACFYMO_09860 [Streptomyces sp. NPDC007025]|uniref:hypothetical protein n=1 Tax=Streptomyces sp. NPDC007025 TaxID=3364771 RepID=UPI0036CDC7E0
MPQPHGFTYEQRGPAGTVVISHRGHPVTTLRDGRAQRFLQKVSAGDEQLVMARWTGNYKRGNERTARAHPRNRGR